MQFALHTAHDMVAGLGGVDGLALAVDPGLDDFTRNGRTDADQEIRPLAVEADAVGVERLAEFGLHVDHVHASPQRRYFVGRPRALAAPSRKPRTIANSSGSSSRKASWPLSVTISANETRAPPALSACTMARESEVGNSQSEVNETTQKRVGVFLNALARTPS